MLQLRDECNCGPLSKVDPIVLANVLRSCTDIVRRQSELQNRIKGVERLLVKKPTAEERILYEQDIDSAKIKLFKLKTELEDKLSQVNFNEQVKQNDKPKTSIWKKFISDVALKRQYTRTIINPEKPTLNTASIGNTKKL